MSDLIVPLQNGPPRLRFHAGEVGPDHQPLLLPDLPPIPGPASPWYLAQWQQDQYLLPAQVKPFRNGTAAGWKAETADGHAALLIEKTGSSYAYTLRERDGRLKESGGTNLFLATHSLPVTADFGAPVILRITARLSEADISYSTPTAESTGAVMAMAFIGLGLSFHHSGLPNGFVFMQVPITSSRLPRSEPGIICQFANGSPKMLLYAPVADPVPFRPSAESWTRRYDLSGFVNGMLSRPFPCGGHLVSWPVAQRDPARWTLGGLYIGLEVQNRDDRAGASTHLPQGHAAASLEIRELSISREPPVSGGD